MTRNGAFPSLSVSSPPFLERPPQRGGASGHPDSPEAPPVGGSDETDPLHPDYNREGDGEVPALSAYDLVMSLGHAHAQQSPP